MLKVIKRVLRLSGDLSKRIYASFVFSFIDSIMAMFPVGAVFYTLTKIQNNKGFAGNDWLVLFGILIISLVVRMVFKYLVYSFQSTAGFEFVSRERITLGDKLRNVGMGFFHERNMGDITTTVTTDLNFLENYSMLPDKSMERVWSITYQALYLNYDIQEDFREQFQKNSDRLIDALEHLPVLWKELSHE